MRRLIATAAMLAAFVLPAKADLIDGTLTMWPLGIVSGSGDTQKVTLNSGQLLPPSFATHDFLPFAGTSFTMQNLGTPIPWQTFGSDSDLTCGLTCIATGTDGLATWALNFTALFSNINTETKLDLTGQGILTMTGHDPTLANWWLTWSEPMMLTFAPPPPNWLQFSIETVHPAHAPGPIVGAGLPGLGAFGFWLLFKRRRANGLTA